jgi:hypothetical protein
MVSASSCARASQRIPRRRDQIDHYPEYVSQHAPTLHPSQKSQRLAERAAFLLNLIVMTTHKRRQLHARQRLTAYHAPLEIGRRRGILIGGDHEATGLNKERGPLGILLGIEGGREGGREEGGYRPSWQQACFYWKRPWAMKVEGGRKEGKEGRRKRGRVSMWLVPPCAFSFPAFPSLPPFPGREGIGPSRARASSSAVASLCLQHKKRCCDG